MATSIAQELAKLETMTTGQLAERYSQLHGQPSRTRHRAYLLRKVAWRIQALAEGDLSERARKRAAEELANDADVRLMPPKIRTNEPDRTSQRVAVVPVTRDTRLPATGTAIVREYRGRTLRVLVVPDGFEFEGERYKTLTAVTKAITGSHMNGFRFFRLEEPK